VPAITSRRHACLAVVAVCALLVAGCADQTPNTSTAVSQPSTTSTTVAATTTTVPPMTAKELAWLKAIPKVRTKIDKTMEATSNLTIAAMRKLATTLRSCSRELARGGAPSDRLQPVYALVKKACKEYDKGAACFTTAADIGIPFGGSAEDRKQQQAIQCGFDASGKGGIHLLDAENKGDEIKAEVG
jgi:hypothetical protein